MTFEELLEKYQAVLLENSNLKEELETLYTKLGVSEHRAIIDGRSDNVFVDSLFPTPDTFTEVSNHVSEGNTLQSNINSMWTFMIGCLNGCTINGLTDMPRLGIKQKARVLHQSQSM